MLTTATDNPLLYMALWCVAFIQGLVSHKSWPFQYRRGNFFPTLMPKRSLKTMLIIKSCNECHIVFHV